MTDKPIDPGSTTRPVREPALIDAALPFQPVKAKEETQACPAADHYDLNLRLSLAEGEKLIALARARGRSPERCIRDFIASCNPSGSCP